MAVKASEADVLREAVRDQHPNETFEKALGRAVRKNGGTYDFYLELIDRVRRRGKRRKGGLVAAATSLASELDK